MAHLKNRFCLVPFCDLTDCPEGGHHAIGSPLFDALGKPLFPESLAIAVRADIADTKLPRCTGLVVSCNTRPYYSYGAVARKIFEKSQPHKHPEVRMGMEEVMEVGDVRIIEPGGLLDQCEKILLACVAPMTGSTNREILEKSLECCAKIFSDMNAGSSLRMPLIGTGKARTTKATEREFREVVDITLSKFHKPLLEEKTERSPSRLLIVNPLEYESFLIATMLGEKAMFLSLLDKMGSSVTNQRMVYGLAHGETEKYQFVDAKNFAKALDHFDEALEKLLGQKRNEALKEGARGAEIEPALRGMFSYISHLATTKKSLALAISKEIIFLASVGRVRDAYKVSLALEKIDSSKKVRELIKSLQDAYVHYNVAALEARLLYESYMVAEKTLHVIHSGATDAEIENDPFLREINILDDNVRNRALEDYDGFQQVEDKIPIRMIENSFHIVIRKLMAEHIETKGMRRALNNLLEFESLGKICIEKKEKKICTELFKLANFIEENKENISDNDLRQEILDKLLELLPDHGTLRLEAGRFYLLKGSKEKKTSLSRNDIIKAWQHLKHGHEVHPRDYGILSYLGFIILLQGNKFLSLAEDFYTLMGKLLEDELLHGRFSIRKVKSPTGAKTKIPFFDHQSEQAYKYYECYLENTKFFAKLAKALSESEGTAALDLYKKAISSLGNVGRYDLANLYEKVLGEIWIALLCSSNHSFGTIPLPFGEISLDLLVNLFKKFRRWLKYRKVRSPKIHKTMKNFVSKLGKRITK